MPCPWVGGSERSATRPVAPKGVRRRTAARRLRVCGVAKRGTVRIRQLFAVNVPFYRFTAHWQPNRPAAPHLFYFEETHWSEAEDAIRWSRQRAPVVYVHVGPGATEHFNAGEQDGSAANERWPRVPRRRAAKRHPDYAGVVYVTEESVSHSPTDEFEASWFGVEGETLEQAMFSDPETAIDWGRQRAPVVLVAEADWDGPADTPVRINPFPVYKVSSAGDEDPHDAVLPRLRPRPGESDLRWEYRIQHAAAALTPQRLAERLSDALRNQSGVISAACNVSRKPPAGASFPAVFRKPPFTDQELAAIEDVRSKRPGPDDWVSITITVAGVTRKAAWLHAAQGLHRALAAVDEPSYGWTGNRQLVQVNYCTAVSVKQASRALAPRRLQRSPRVGTRRRPCSAPGERRRLRPRRRRDRRTSIAAAWTETPRSPALSRLRHCWRAS